MSSSPSPMLPGRSAWGGIDSDRRSLVCPEGHEVYEVARDRRCPVCGAFLKENPVPSSFRQKVRSRVPEPSQHTMDQILADE